MKRWICTMGVDCQKEWSFVDEGEIPPAGFMPCPSQPCFKASLIKESKRNAGSKKM